MAEILSLVSVFVLALLCVRAGTLALQRTGLSRDAAAFQAQSAFMGVGFTTAESESVVAHPVRRRIIRGLMWGGFIGITATVSAAVVAFAAADARPGERAAWLIAFLLVLLFGWRLRPLSRLVDRMLGAALQNIRELRVLDFEELLQLDRGYAVATLPVEVGHWMTDRSLRELRLADEGVLVLSITRASGARIGTPDAESALHAGDHILCYGRQDSLERRMQRPADALGERERRLAVEEQLAKEFEEKVAEERTVHDQQHDDG
jgi:hypothetical protein